MSSRLLFRCDASPAIGAGHVTRCHALALALRGVGAEPAFVMRPGWRVDGFDVFDVPAEPGDEPGMKDLARTLEVAHDTGADEVVVDHYGASSAYFEGLREAGLRVGAIDDRADRDLRAADWVLNQNVSATELPYAVRADTQLLLGLSFALLRPEFALARAAQSRRFAGEDRRVLVTLGGGAKAALCAELLHALESVERPLEVRVVAADSDERLASAAQSSRHAVALTGPVSDIVEHMAWAHVSINGGGSTCWELLCLGVPMVVLALSDDQRRNPPALAERGIAVAVGSFADAAAGLDALLADPGRREAMSRGGAALVDGRGAERAAAAIVGERAGVVD